MDSTAVFQLRNEAKELNGEAKLHKLDQAFQAANELYEESPCDEWVLKAFSWVLIDLCKYYISINNLSQGDEHLDQLKSILYNFYDDIIEKQIIFLEQKIDKNYSIIKKAEDFSKSNKHKEAINIFKQLISENRLTEIHHETYGWAIYRYIKNQKDELTSIQVRTFLRDYINLNNERPSLLHSTILNFALQYSKEHSDFNFYNFFKLWNPKNLREDDISQQLYNGKKIPSLLSRIFKMFIEKESSIDIQYLVDNVSWHCWSLGEDEILDLLREPFFWKIFNANKEKRFSDLWTLFDQYNTKYSAFGQSKWHSEILSLAERYMQESDDWRFLEFFKKWNPTHLMNKDWEEVKKDGHTYKPLAIKCLKKSYENIKTHKNETYKTDWLIEIYNIATSKFPKDNWIKREKALLLIRNNQLNQAIEIYKELVLSLGDKTYTWSEFSSCFLDNNDLKIGMLSKAIQLEKNEDFLGDIHLELAQILIERNLLENANIELLTYKKHREDKDWKLSETYTILHDKLIDIPISLINNQTMYKTYIPLAEEFAYQDISWSNFVLVDIWKDDKNKDRYKFSNGETIEFSIGKQRFKSLTEAKIGNVFNFKLYTEEKEVVEISNSFRIDSRFPTPQVGYRYIPLLSQISKKSNWSILEDEIAVVNYINKEKNVIHAITSKDEEIFFKGNIEKYKINSFIRGKRLVTKRKDEIRIELKDISIIEKSVGIENFKKVIAIVDNVNEEKKLFHFVVNNTIQGIVRFNETDLRPSEGTFLQIYIAKKYDKKRCRTTYKPLDIKETTETNDKLSKTITGTLELKFKYNGYTRELDELDEDEISNIKPDFGFISDFYVPKYILNKYSIKTNCKVTAKAILSGEKWKIIEIVKE